VETRQKRWAGRLFAGWDETRWNGANMDCPVA